MLWTWVRGKRFVAYGGFANTGVWIGVFQICARSVHHFFFGVGIFSYPCLRNLGELAGFYARGCRAGAFFLDDRSPSCGFLLKLIFTNVYELRLRKIGLEIESEWLVK